MRVEHHRGVTLPSDYTEIVEEWLAKLKELQPADGTLTDEILASVGPFPVYRPPGDAYDYRDDHKMSYQYSIAIQARAYARERANFQAKMAVGRSAGKNAD